MDTQPTPEQQALLDAVAPMLAKAAAPPKEGLVYDYDQDLDDDLVASGFHDLARTEGYGLADAALIVELVSGALKVVEAGATMLVAPGLDLDLPHPIALVADARRPARFLSVARSAIVLDDGGAVALELQPGQTETADGIFAYPMGRFTSPVTPTEGVRLSRPMVRKLMSIWRLSLALEAAGAMRGALDFTVEYVKTRRQFNRAIGSYQALQHRLAERTVAAKATRLLALQAAWSGDPAHAALAATYAQGAIPAVIHDCQQFNGANGVTYEHPLHYWTFRLAALQGELGGVSAQAQAAAELLWGQDESP